MILLKGCKDRITLPRAIISAPTEGARVMTSSLGWGFVEAFPLGILSADASSMGSTGGWGELT